MARKPATHHTAPARALTATAEPAFTHEFTADPVTGRTAPTPAPAPLPENAIFLPVTAEQIGARAQVVLRVAINAVRDLESAPMDGRLAACVAELDALARLIPTLEGNR